MSLHVERSGAGPDLALLHGWGLHGGVWSPVAQALAARHRVHAIDLPGHGHSAATAFAGLESAADAVAEAIPEASLVCGWSLGGLVALAVALRYPARVRALALVSTTPCFVAREGWPHAMAPATLAQFAAGLREAPEATIATFVRLNALGAPGGREAARALAREVSSRGAPDPASLAAGLRALGETDLRGELARVRVPAVVVHGRRDRLAPVEAGRRLAAGLARSRLFELEAAHLPFVSHPREFVAAIGTLDG